jgi:hypothetical protein
LRPWRGYLGVGLARLATRFLLLSQKKSGKEKAALCHGLTASLRCTRKGHVHQGPPLCVDLGAIGMAAGDFKGKTICKSDLYAEVETQFGFAFW